MTASAPRVGDTLLDIQDLQTHFYTQDGTVRAVNGVNFSIKAGQTLGVVGESGCGKSITAMSVMRLIQRTGKIVTGRILLQGEDLLSKTEEDMRDIRG